MDATFHRLRVMALYRDALRELQNYATKRVWIYKWIEDVRGRFEVNKGLTDSGAIESIFRAGVAELKAKRHPAPYKYPWMPGGNAYGRNPPAPKIKFLRDYNREPGTFEHLVPQAPGYHFSGDWDRNLGQGPGVTDTSKYDNFPYYGPTRFDRNEEEKKKLEEFLKTREDGLKAAEEAEKAAARHKYY